MKRFWDWLRRTLGLVVEVRVAVFADGHRFHVVYATDKGADARDVYAALTPRTGTVAFYDGEACRGQKIGAD